MAKTVVRPSTRRTTIGKTFAIGRLPIILYGEQISTIRKAPLYTLTVASAFTSASSDQLSLTLTQVNGTAPTAGTKVYVDGGLILNFGTNKVVKVAEGKEVGTTATPVTIIDPDAPVTLATTDTTITKALIFVNGCSNATVSPQIQNEDGTTYLSGTGKEMVTVSNAKELAFEFRAIYGDRGGDVLYDIMYEDSDIGREFYFEVRESSGEIHEGVAILNSASPQGGVQQLVNISGSAQVQGDSYVHTKATVTAVAVV
jgi:hypothetical protein